MRVYYNEHDRFAAAWLRELMRDGLIPSGDVDERDIQTVQPTDLAGYDQCHFFAGIGGWAYALELAEWDGPVWTGSCPCQPFSQAGKGAGFADARHLWPTWFRLVRECRPPVVFGEQVGGPDGYHWLDLVSTDLEEAGYAFGAADLAAASVGAPHIRQRLYFVADPEGRGWGVCGDAAQQGGGRYPDGSESARLVADAGRWSVQRRSGFGLADPPCRVEGAAQERERLRADAGAGDLAGVAQGDTSITRLEGYARHGSGSLRSPGQVQKSDRPVTEAGSLGVGQADTNGRRLEQHSQLDSGQEQPGQPAPQRDDIDRCNPWADVVWLPCRDGYFRPSPPEPALQPLAHGLPNRVGALRGAGNAICAPLAAEFVSAYMETKR